VAMVCHQVDGDGHCTLDQTFQPESLMERYRASYLEDLVVGLNCDRSDYHKLAKHQ
jgi:hypothetical protein